MDPAHRGRDGGEFADRIEVAKHGVKGEGDVGRRPKIVPQKGDKPTYPTISTYFHSNRRSGPAWVKVEFRQVFLLKYMAIYARPCPCERWRTVTLHYGSAASLLAWTLCLLVTLLVLTLV